MLERASDIPVDPVHVRKARGAFFTPDNVARYLVDWAVRDPSDRVFEPSVGDAAFAIQAVRRLRRLGATTPVIAGAEIHPPTAAQARRRVQEEGGELDLKVDNFFHLDPEPLYAAVVGNPPFIRYQTFAGEVRAKARAAALRAGVTLSSLASSWAAFTVNSAQFLKPGGRMALVLPAELLSVNYAGEVRHPRVLTCQAAVGSFSLRWPQAVCSL